MEENKAIIEEEDVISEVEPDIIIENSEELEEELSELSDEALQDVAGGGGHRVPYRG